MAKATALTVGSLLLPACLLVVAGIRPQGTPSPAIASAPEKPAATGQPGAARPSRRRLSWSDLEYLGAFSAPRIFSGAEYGSRYGYSGSVMCWNPNGDPDGEPDGFPGSIMVAGHPSKGLIGEFSIPAPKLLGEEDKQADGTYDTRRLPAGEQLGKFFDPSGGRKNVFEKRSELWGGLWWDGDELHMSWNLWYHVDSEVKDYPNHMAAKRGANGAWQMTIEPYSFPNVDPHRIAGYVSTAPKWWAEEYLGGRRFLGGFNVAQGTGASNSGPGLYAYDPKAPQAALVLMEFPHHRAGTTHDDNWKPCDRWRGLALIDTGTKYAVLFCGRKSLGEVYYGIGRPTDVSKAKGYHCDPYRPEVRLYDPSVFLEVLDGKRKPHEPRPYEMIDLTSTFFQPDRAFLTAGIGYDPANRLVYISQMRGESDSSRYESVPVIHVWRIK